MTDLSDCECTPPPFGDGPEIDCPFHGIINTEQRARLVNTLDHAAAVVRSSIVDAKNRGASFDLLDPMYSAESEITKLRQYVKLTPWIPARWSDQLDNVRRQASRIDQAIQCMSPPVLPF